MCYSVGTDVLVGVCTVIASFNKLKAFIKSGASHLSYPYELNHTAMAVGIATAIMHIDSAKKISM